jgi:hypothetical protein
VRIDVTTPVLSVYGYTKKEEGCVFLSIIGPFNRYEVGVDQNFDFEVDDEYGPPFLYLHNLRTGKLHTLYLGRVKK